MKIPEAPPDLTHSFSTLLSTPAETRRILTQLRPVDAKGRYLSWDEVRNRRPPNGLTREEWWLGMRLARNASAMVLPLEDVRHRHHRFSFVNPLQEGVHLVDQQASGTLLASDVQPGTRAGEQFMVASLMEEAITSSQLEGASTTRKVAKEMLASGRRPRTRGERMIVNNYRAIRFATSMATEELTPDIVFELHRTLTEGTLDNPDAAGRLQRPDEERVKVYWHDDTLLHDPPPAIELPDRLQALCDFANGRSDVGFIHPVIRAIVLHYALAYDHPFEDGNGRTARALFYWSMLRHGYWLTQYISVSSILLASPARYARSYLYCQSDDSDITYFIDFQLNVILRAIASLRDYIARRSEETRRVEDLIHHSPLFNNRQLDILRRALRDPTLTTTIRAEAGRHRVTHESARRDLQNLEHLGLLDRVIRSGTYEYSPVVQIEERLRGLRPPATRPSTT